MHTSLKIFITIMIFCNTILAQSNSKLDKSQLDLNYYTKLKDQNITINVCNWGEYIANGDNNSMDVVKEFEDLTGIKVNYIYLNNYTLSKVKLYFCFYIWGFAPYHTSFATEGSACDRRKSFRVVLPQRSYILDRLGYASRKATFGL